MQSNVSDPGESGAAGKGKGEDSSLEHARSDTEPTGPWWSTRSGVLNAVAIVAIVAAGMVAIFSERPKPRLPPVADVPVRTATETALEVSPTALPRVVLDGPAEVSFDQPHPAAYTILGIESEPKTREHFGLRVHIGLHNHTDGTLNFSTENFVLLIDGEPRGPAAELTGSVAGNSSGEATVTYTVPHGAKALVLRIVHVDSHGGTAELPLRLVSAGESTEATARTQ